MTIYERAFENIVGKHGNDGDHHFLLWLLFYVIFKSNIVITIFRQSEKPNGCLKFNSLPDMPSLGSSNSAANKDITSKI